MAIYKVTTADLGVNVSASSNIKYPTNSNVFRASDAWRSNSGPGPTPGPTPLPMYTIQPYDASNDDMYMLQQQDTADVAKYAFSIWFNLGTFSTDRQYLFNKQDNDTMRLEFFNSDLLGAGVHKYITFYLDNGAASGTRIAVDMEAFLSSADTWVHALAFFDGSLTGNDNRQQLWLNGVKQASVHKLGADDVADEYNAAWIDTYHFGTGVQTSNYHGKAGQIRVYWSATAGGAFPDAATLAALLYGGGSGNPDTQAGQDGLFYEFLFNDVYADPTDIADGEVLDTSGNGYNASTVNGMKVGAIVELGE